MSGYPPGCSEWDIDDHAPLDELGDRQWVTIVSGIGYRRVHVDNCPRVMDGAYLAAYEAGEGMRQGWSVVLLEQLETGVQIERWRGRVWV